MADSRDKPELETLGYEPTAIIGSDANGANSEQPNQKSRELTKEEIEKIDSDMKKLGFKPIYEDKKLDQPNQNLMIIEEIEGLLSQANEKMYELPIHTVRSKAIEEIGVLQSVTISIELRKAFE